MAEQQKIVEEVQRARCGAQSIDVNPQNFGQVLNLTKSLEQKMVKYQFGFEHLSKTSSQKQNDDIDLEEEAEEEAEEENEEEDEGKNEEHINLKSKLEDPSCSKTKLPKDRKRKSNSSATNRHAKRNKSVWVTSDIIETDKVQKVHRSQMDVSLNQLQNDKLFSTILGNEYENGISMENNEIPREISELSSQNKENEHVHTANTSEIIQNPMLQSQIQPNLQSSRENLTIAESQAKVPKYVTVHPLFTKKHMEFVGRSGNNSVIAKCFKCNQNKLGSFTTISNFKLHFKRKHSEVYAQLENSNVPNEEVKKLVKNNSINKKGVNVSQEDVDAAIIRFIIQDMQPFIRTETAAFQNLIAVCLGYPNISEFPFNFMSERTVKRQIFNLYDEHVKDLEKILSMQKWFSLTMDIWSCKNRSYLAVSIHYIDDKTFERKSFLLTCQDFPSPHTHEHITERLQMLYHKFSLKPSSIVASVTDNGSNFVCAFKNFGRTREGMAIFFEQLKKACNENDSEDFPPDAEIMKITDALTQLSSDELSGISESDLENEADHLYELIDSRDEESDDSAYNRNSSSKDSDLEHIDSVITNVKMNEDDLLMLPNRIPCNTHILNLVGGVDSLAAYKNKTFAKMYQNVFEKLNLLWHASGRQKTSKIIVKCLGRNFNKPNKTRWNWLNDRISEILQFDSIKLNLTMMSLEIPIFTESQRQFLLEYKFVLSPIAKALDNLQQGKAPYAIVLPTIYDASKKLNRIKDGNSLKHCKPLVTAILRGFDKRLGHLLNVDDENSHAAIIATVTHPFFKLRWIATEERTPKYIEQVINILTNAANEIFIENSHRVSDTGSSSRNTEPNEISVEKTAKKPSFQYTFYDDDSAASSVSSDIAQANVNHIAEITKYLNLECTNNINDLEQQLNMFETIKQLYLKFNVIMPSEADVERIFSFGGLIMRPHRRHMKSEIFEKVIILKSNCYPHRNNQSDNMHMLARDILKKLRLLYFHILPYAGIHNK